MGDGKSETLLKVYVSDIVLRRGIEIKIVLRIGECSFKCSALLISYLHLFKGKSRLWDGWS